MSTIIELNADSTRRVWYFDERVKHDAVMGLVAKMGIPASVAISRLLRNGTLGFDEVSYRDLPPAKEIGNTGYYQLMEEGE